MTWQIALAVAAALFGAFIAWQVRPSFGPPKVRKARRAAFAEARARLSAATTATERAMALCDVGDARSAMGGPRSVTGALGYYLRAMRSDPDSPEPVIRAARGLARRPRTLESLLWRRLGSVSWEGEHRASALAALAELERVYGGSLRNRSRASALGFALAALGQPPSATATEGAAARDQE